jgi:hypothetical protein
MPRANIQQLRPVPNVPPLRLVPTVPIVPNNAARSRCFTAALGSNRSSRSNSSIVSAQGALQLSIKEFLSAEASRVLDGCLIY